MGPDGRLSVAVIYSHPLLGEGIGQMLAAEPDMAVSQAACDDSVRTAAVLNTNPDVIVLERNCSVGPTEILRASPDTLVIETSLYAGTTWAYRRQEIPNHPEAVLALVRRLRGGHPAVLGEAELADGRPLPVNHSPLVRLADDARPVGAPPTTCRAIGELVHGS